MKKLLRVVGIVLGIAVLAVGALIGWLALRSPEMRPASAEAIQRTPERLARGRYVVEHVSDCLGCHSDHVIRYAIPVKPGTEGQGGFPFDVKFGVPGIVCAQNITPDPEFGIGRWTDGEVMRAFREGVTPDGRALFPMMPYQSFRNMSDEDAKSVVVYLRSLKPIHHPVPPRHIDFPVNLLIKFEPKPVDHEVVAPDPKDHLAYGEYLVGIAGCAICHTPVDAHGKPLEGRRLSGGWEMVGPWGRVVTANLTPDPHTYMGTATKGEFIGRFKSFEGFDASTSPEPQKGRNTLMPWLGFSGMTSEDLGAIYDYLKTLKPIENHPVIFPDQAKS